MVLKFSLPLHSLFGKPPVKLLRKSSLKGLHKTEKVVQEAGAC